LAAVVGRHGFTMGRTVVLESQALRWVVQVRSSDEMAFGVVKRNLDLGSGQAGQDEEEAKSCLHRALGGWLGQFDSAPKVDVPREPLVHLKPGFEVAHFEKPLMQRGVEHCDPFNQWETTP
jgi:hypothetical protein